MHRNIGDAFQQQTKYEPGKLFGKGLNWHRQPELYKQYPSSEIVTLPEKTEPKALFDTVLKQRRSIRQYTNKPLMLVQLSYLLWASTGIERKEQGYEFRTAPSAGALYPIETYLVVNTVTNLDSGVYHYNIKNHYLETLKIGDFRRQITQAALGQRICGTAAVVFIWTAIFQRSKWKYDQRAYRYIYLDTGHIAENLALACTTLNLGSCQIGALYDDEVNKIVDVDGVEESVVYMSSIGVPR